MTSIQTLLAEVCNKRSRILTNPIYKRDIAADLAGMNALLEKWRGNWRP